MPQVLKESYSELVQKAQDLFWVNGYKSVSQQELAEHLGVSLSTIYNKYSKEMLFLDALDYYIVSCTDPVLKIIQESDEGIKTFNNFYYLLIDGIIDRTFPKSCLMVNTVIEMRNEDPRVVEVYERYFVNMKASFLVVLNRAVDLGEIKEKHRLEEYAEFLIGLIFALAVLYKINSREELRAYIDEKLKVLI